MKRAISLTCAIVLMLSLMLLGHGIAVAEFNPGDYTLAIVIAVKGHPVHRIVEMGFVERAKELGYEAIILGPDTASEPETIAAAEAGIGMGVKGMLVWAWSPAFYPAVEKANAAGVKTVVPHFVIPEGSCPGLDANLSADAVAYGREAAKAIANELGDKAGTIAITQGSFTTAENDAAKGFSEEMKNYPNLTVLDPIEEGLDTAASIPKAVAIIQAYPDLLGAFSTTGGGPITWAGAKDQTGKQDLVCIGMDYTEQNIDLVKEGKIFAIVAQPLYDEASRSAELLDAMLRGESVPYFTPLEAPIAKADTIDQYLAIIERVKKTFQDN